MFKSKLYNFIIDPKCRIWRHILFILFFALISYRQVTYLFNDQISVNCKLILIPITLTVYLITLYANIYFFVPRYLLNKKYKLYLVSLFFIIFVQVSYLFAMEYVVQTHFELPYRIKSYNFFVFIQCIPTATINLLCVLGTSVTVLFKHQASETRRVSQMEQENIKSELDRLKEQISPRFLSNILNKTAVLVKTDPGKAYTMLMKLGQLLRYQLYDSAREKVLLRAEINFVKEYLELSQLFCSGIDYKVDAEIGTKDMFISPLLFIPFIQQSINTTSNNESVSIQIFFSVENADLTFVCQSSYKEILSDDELFAIKKRLELIYPNNYSLSIEREKVILQLFNISRV